MADQCWPIKMPKRQNRGKHHHHVRWIRGQCKLKHMRHAHTFTYTQSIQTIYRKQCNLLTQQIKFIEKIEKAIWRRKKNSWEWVAQCVLKTYVKYKIWTTCAYAHTVPYLVSFMGFFSPSFLHCIYTLRCAVCASILILRICNIAQNQWIIYSNITKIAIAFNRLLLCHLCAYIGIELSLQPSC